MSSLTTQRDLDFAKACRHHTRQALTRGERPTQTEIIDRAVSSGAPGYYVEFEYARKRLYGVQSGRVTLSSRSKSTMWAELAAKVEALRRRKPMSKSDALQLVLSGGQASRFFMTTDYATKLYQRMRHRRRPLLSENDNSTTIQRP